MLPVSGSNYYVTSSPNLAGWECYLTPATLQPCKRRARFRLWLARSASKSCHKRYGERRTMMKKLLLLAFIAVACEAMAQDAQCVPERAAMVEIIRAYARSGASLLGPQGIS
jgi:hypothetical protein